MAAKGSTTTTRSYQEMEPYCKWHKGDEQDILEVYLPGFRRDQLRVQINNLGVLTFSGERPLNETTWSRFRKETKVAEECKTTDIRAKFSNGILYITMPKTKTSPETRPASAQQSGRQKQELNKDKETDHHNGSAADDEDGRLSMSKKTIKSYKDRLISRLKMDKDTGMKVSVAVAVVVAAALGAYITFKCYQQIHIEN